MPMPMPVSMPMLASVRCAQATMPVSLPVPMPVRCAMPLAPIQEAEVRTASQLVAVGPADAAAAPGTPPEQDVVQDAVHHPVAGIGTRRDQGPVGPIAGSAINEARGTQDRGRGGRRCYRSGRTVAARGTRSSRNPPGRAQTAGSSNAPPRRSQDRRGSSPRTVSQTAGTSPLQPSRRTPTVPDQTPQYPGAAQ